MAAFQRGTPAPKPYRMLSIPLGRSDLRRPPGHDRIPPGSLTGRITGEIIALSPVHVASGGIELVGPRPTLAKAFFRSGGAPALPGSSLKGVFRSIAEAISDPISCLRVTSARPDATPNAVRPCRDKDRLCPACRLFGALGYQGRVMFSDAPQTSGDVEVIDTPSLFAPRTRERTYFDRGVVRGRKFYGHGRVDHSGRVETASGNVPLEACLPKSQFALRMDFESLSHGELGLLLTALGQSKPMLTPKLGGSKPSCFGSIRVAVSGVALFADTLDFDALPQIGDIALLARDQSLVNPQSLGALADVLKFPGEEPCPAGNY